MKQDDPGESDLPMALAQPARRALVGAGYRRREQWRRARARRRLKPLHGVGLQATTQLRRALVDRASRSPTSRVETRRSLSSRMKHEIHRRDLAVPPFPHHPTIERSAFDEKNYRPIFHNA